MAKSSIPQPDNRAYVYEILVDGIVRYIGKGRNGRLRAHVSIAKALLIRRGRGETVRTSKFYNGLASALAKGKEVGSRIVRSDLTDHEAYLLEVDLIAASEKGNLWNLLPGGKGGDPAFFKTFWQDPEPRRFASEAQKARWLKPEFRDRMECSLRAACKTLEFRAMRSRDMKERFSRSEYKQHHAEVTRQRWLEDGDTIRSNIQRGKEAARRKFSEATRKKWADPDYRAKVCAAQSIRWRNPEARKKSSDTMKEKCSDPVFRQDQSERGREKWKDPVYRERHKIAVVAAGLRRRQSRIIGDEAGQRLVGSGLRHES